MRTKINKILIILLVMMIILPAQMIQVLATGIGDSPYLEKGDLGFYSIQYQSRSSGNWYYITYSRTWYTDEQGVRRIAYCVNPDSSGIGWVEGEVDGYHVDLKSALSDDKLWRVYRHGYPYVTPQELGVETEDDAYLATKQAGYWIIRGYNLEDIRTYFRPGEIEINGQNLNDIQRRGKKVIDAIYHLVDLGYNGKETPKYNNIIKINKDGNFIQDENGEYYSQKYTVTSSTDMSGYTIKNITNFPEGSYIADLNGNGKTTFSSGEKFKVMIPKKAISQNVIGKIEIESKCQNYPVYYGEARDGNSQNYAVTVDSYSNIVETTKLDINAYKSNIKLTKVDEETKEKLSGVKFNFKYEDGTNIGDYTTDKNGEINIKNLKQGTIIATEVETTNEYILDTKENKINLEYNNTTTITIENEHKKGNLKVYKVDKDNNRVTLKDVEFDLYSEEYQKVIGTYRTDVNGEIYVENLRIGNYKLIEKSTNKWYNLNTEATDIEVEWDKTKNFTIENELKKGSVRVIKVDEDDNKTRIPNVTFEILDKNNKMLEKIKTNQNGEATTKEYAIRDFKELKIHEIETDQWYVLNGETKTVELEANQIKDIIFTNEKKKGQIRVIKVDKDNNKVLLEGVVFDVLDEKGEIVDTIKTNLRGEATTKRLPIDQRYTIVEKETRQEYVLTKEIQTVTLEQDQIKTIKFKNEKKKGQIRVIKVDKDDNEVLLEGVKFDILDEKGKTVDTIKTDSKGEATTKRLSIDQKYTIVEKETRQEYVLTEETQTVKLEQDRIKNITFKNEKIKGQIQINKFSADDNKLTGEKKGTLLKGAVFEVLDENDRVVDTVTTGADGKAISKLLVKGKYHVVEKSSGSPFYLVNREVFDAEIVNHKQIVGVTVEEESVDIDVEVEKRGFKETQSKDTIYYDFSNIHNKSNVELSDFIWSDSLPTNAVRPNKIYTGTWNEDLRYSVWYKTNLSDDFIILKDNLSTGVNNEVKFTEVQLKEGEFITDYEFRFGTVKPDFKEIDEPRLYCDVLDNLGNGFVFVNHTKVCGRYEDKYVEDTDEWLTVTYNKEIQLEKLPRTGDVDYSILLTIVLIMIVNCIGISIIVKK